MKIKHKNTNKVLLKVDADTLRGADLSGADLSGAKGEFIFNWGVKLKVVE